MIHAQAQRQGFEIERMCALAGVSRAGYYRNWQASAPRQEETALRDEIQRLSLANRHHGYRIITVLLRRAGWAVNHKRVQRLRRQDNLLSLAKPAFRPATTDSRHRYLVYPNLARRLIPMAVNQLWVADITYVRLSEEFVYLAVVLDAFSRRVVWRIIFSPAWRWKLWRWRCGRERCSPAWYITRIAVCSMRVGTTSNGLRRSASSPP